MIELIRVAIKPKSLFTGIVFMLTITYFSVVFASSVWATSPKVRVTVSLKDRSGQTLPIPGGTYVEWRDCVGNSRCDSETRIQPIGAKGYTDFFSWHAWWITRWNTERDQYGVYRYCNSSGQQCTPKQNYCYRTSGYYCSHTDCGDGGCGNGFGHFGCGECNHKFTIKFTASEYRDHCTCTSPVICYGNSAGELIALTEIECSCGFAYCGDNVVQRPNSDNFNEVCDEGYGAGDNGDGKTNVGAQGCGYGKDCCSLNCSKFSGPYCGDGSIAVSSGEECDNGSANTDFCAYGDTCCSTSCKNLRGEYCGDNKKNGLEQCDEGSLNGIACTPEYEGSCSYCNASCQERVLRGGYCGDKVIDTNEGEECDDGDVDDLNSCDNSCSITYCGDGKVQSPNGKRFLDGGDKFFEECDDGNNIDGDGCSFDCLEEGQPWLVTEDGDVFSKGGFCVEGMPSGSYLSSYLCLTEGGIGSIDVGGGCSLQRAKWQFRGMTGVLRSKVNAEVDKIEKRLDELFGDGSSFSENDINGFKNPGGGLPSPIFGKSIYHFSGNLTIDENMTYSGSCAEETCGVLVLVSGNLEIESNVERVLGLYIVKGGVSIPGSSDLVQLTVDGGIIAKGQIKPGRTLGKSGGGGVGNEGAPAEIIIYDPRYIDIFRDIFGESSNVKFVESGVY